MRSIFMESAGLGDKLDTKGGRIRRTWVSPKEDRDVTALDTQTDRQCVVRLFPRKCKQTSFNPSY